MTGNQPDENGAMMDPPAATTPAPDSAPDPINDETGHGEVIRGLLQDVLEAGGLDASAVLRKAGPDGVELSIEGPDAPAMIGKQGHALNSTQYLLGLMATRRLGERIRITVDAEDYRARRADALIKQALSLAAEVRAHNQEVEMDPLNAMERRIIHTALLEEPDIHTYSEGEEPNRRVVISPNKD